MTLFPRDDNAPFVKQVWRGFDVMNPLVRDQFRGLAEHMEKRWKLEDTPTLFRVFETYRHPARQQDLFERRPPVTKAQAFESAHQYGLAADFVAIDVINGKQTWSWAEGHDWDYLKKQAALFDLEVPISWDRGHVESRLWQVVKRYVM